jgi:hypothetical protein
MDASAQPTYAIEVYIVRISPLLAFVLGSPLLVGCGAAPVKLKYVQYEDGRSEGRGDYSGLTKFSLAKSILLVRSAETGGPALMTSVPAEASGPLTHFGVQQENSAGASHLLTVTKLDNSNLVHRLTSNAQLQPDQPYKNVASSGAPTAVAASVDLPTSKKTSAALSLPLAIDTGRLLDQAFRGPTTMWAVSENSNRKIAFEIAFDAVPTDAIETRQLDLAKASGLYFYSACRTATVTFLTAPLTRQQFTVTVADPHFVQTIAVAPQSSITSHSGCGVDIHSPVAEAPQALNELNQAIAQARSLNTAWQTVPGTDKASAIAEAEAANKAAQKTVKAAAAKAAAATAAAEQKKRDEALRNAEVQLPKRAPSTQTFAF